MRTPAPDTKWLQCRVSEAVHRKLRVTAAETGLTMGQILSHLVTTYTDQAITDLTT